MAQGLDARDIAVRLADPPPSGHDGATWRALTTPMVLKSIEGRSGTPMGGTPEEFGEHVRKETERLAKLIKAIGIKPQ